MYITYEFNNWWKYHFATFTWKISQHFEGFVVSIIIGQLLHFFRNACIKSGSLRFHIFPVVDWFCLFIYLWVLTLPLEDCSEFGYFVITFTEYLYHRWPWICSFCHQHSPALLPCYSLIYYFAMLTIVSLFVLFFLYFLISINGFCLLRWYLQTFRWQTHSREEVTE
jgi:hypothetical protein